MVFALLIDFVSFDWVTYQSPCFKGILKNLLVAEGSYLVRHLSTNQAQKIISLLFRAKAASQTALEETINSSPDPPNLDYPSFSEFDCSCSVDRVQGSIITELLIDCFVGTVPVPTVAVGVACGTGVPFSSVLPVASLLCRGCHHTQPFLGHPCCLGSVV